MAVQIKTTKKFPAVFPHLSAHLLADDLPVGGDKFLDSIVITVEKASMKFTYYNPGGAGGCESVVALLPGVPHKILSGEVAVTMSTSYFEPIRFAIVSLFKTMKSGELGQSPPVESPKLTAKVMPPEPAFEEQVKLHKTKIKIPNAPLKGDAGLLLGSLVDITHGEQHKLADGLTIPKEALEALKHIKPTPGVMLQVGTDLTDLVFHQSAMSSAPTVPLIHATKLYQPVDGTSSGSRYYVVAIHPECKMAARYKNGKLSVRLEGAMAGKVAGSIGAGAGGSHYSTHLSVPPHEVLKVLGSMISAVDLEWVTPSPKLGYVVQAA